MHAFRNREGYPDGGINHGAWKVNGRVLIDGPADNSRFGVMRQHYGNENLAIHSSGPKGYLMEHKYIGLQRFKGSVP